MAVKISSTFTLEKLLSQQRNLAVGVLVCLRTRSFLQGDFLFWIRGALALLGRYRSVGGETEPPPGPSTGRGARV